MIDGDWRQTDADEWQLELAADRVERDRDVAELLGEHREGVADHATFIAEIAGERAVVELADQARVDRLDAAERARRFTDRVTRPRTGSVR